VCPTSVPENAEKTRQISSLHFLLRYIGDRLQVIDKGSTNGTSLSSQGAIQPNTAADLKDGDRITVAEVLNLAVDFVERAPSAALDEGIRAEIAAHLEDADWLAQRLVGPSKPGFLDFARLRRIDNLPEEEYVLLFGVGIVGSSSRALISVEAEAATRPAVRALDLGDTTPDYPAAFHWRDGALHLRSNVANQVRVNGTAMSAGEERALSGGEIIEVFGKRVEVTVKP
jgi:pSer/pThr/pTyr-binding forkhead associated (FHA) protein